MYEALLTKPNITRRTTLIRPRGFDAQEDCCICGEPTATWAEAKDVPLCIPCEEKTEPGKVPTKKEWLTKLGFVLEWDWKAGA